MKWVYPFLAVCFLFPFFSYANSDLQKEEVDVILQKFKVTLNFNFNNPYIAGKEGIFGIKVENENSEPIQEVLVYLRVSGGVFKEVQNSSQSGQTNDIGWLYTTWALPNRAGSYQLQWKITYPGFETKKGVKIIEVVTPPKEIKVQWSFTPSQIVVENKTTINLFVFEEVNGRHVPVRDAVVQLNASTGNFSSNQQKEYYGKTGLRGSLIADWYPSHSDRKCAFEAIVKKNGSSESKTFRKSVQVSEQLKGMAILKIGLKNEWGVMLKNCNYPNDISVVAIHKSSGSIYEGKIGTNCECTIPRVPGGSYKIQLITVVDRGDLMEQPPTLQVHVQDNKVNWIYLLKKD
jgi:hypothetical protein